MLRKKRKSNQNFLRGGYRQYRAPSVFGGGKAPKPKREFQLPKINIKLIVYTVATIFALYYVLLSGKFSVKDIIVEGAHLTSDDKVLPYINKGSNILFLNTSSLRKKILTENPQIKDVQIVRGIPDAVKIVLLEHENKIIWQSSGSKYLISAQGEATKRVEDGETFNYPIVNDSKNLPVILGQSIVSPNFIAFIVNINEKFFEATNIKQTYFEVPQTTFDLYLYTEAGFYVKFNSMRSSAKQLENLKKVLVEKRSDVHEYVDLRIDGWAYYK